MIALAHEAEAHVNQLIAHYEAKSRLEASINLLNALDRARLRIAQTPEAGLHAPRPYPSLKRVARRWIVEGAFWIAYNLTEPPVIFGVFYVLSDIPSRV